MQERNSLVKQKTFWQSSLYSSQIPQKNVWFHNHLHQERLSRVIRISPTMSIIRHAPTLCWGGVRKGRVQRCDLYLCETVINSHFLSGKPSEEPGLPTLPSSTEAHFLLPLGWCQRMSSEKLGLLPLANVIRHHPITRCNWRPCVQE